MSLRRCRHPPPRLHVLASCDAVDLRLPDSMSSHPATLSTPASPTPCPRVRSPLETDGINHRINQTYEGSSLCHLILDVYGINRNKPSRRRTTYRSWCFFRIARCVASFFRSLGARDDVRRTVLSPFNIYFDLLGFFCSVFVLFRFKNYSNFEKVQT
jgi:hypothetical protein